MFKRSDSKLRQGQKVQFFSDPEKIDLVKEIEATKEG
jgi:hypothetical protein